MARTASPFPILLLPAHAACGPALPPSYAPGDATPAEATAAETRQSDARGIEFRAVSAQKVDGAPTFVLPDVKDFRRLGSDAVAGVRLERVERHEL